jgi:hypothetical protein
MNADIPVPGTPLPWATGSYRATETFRTVELHEAIMQDNGAEEAQGLLIAACGAAHDPQTIQDVEYIVEAANAYPTLVAELVKVRAALVVVDNLYEAATTQRDALLEAAQAMYDLHKDSPRLRHVLGTDDHVRDAALEALRDALVKIAAATKEVQHGN